MVDFDRAVYQPSPWSQKFHETTEDEVLGGGSAGPGKSLTLLWDPICTQAIIEHARMSGQLLDQLPTGIADLCRRYPIRQGESEGHALHLRRSMPQLLENIDRSQRMFPKFDPGANYSRERHSWTFSSGYKFTFGHCRERDSHQDYLSKQYCVAVGTRVLMADLSLRAIENISVGEEVLTLEGPRRVLATHNSGEKPCVLARVFDVEGRAVSEQVHPVDHRVLTPDGLRHGPPTSSTGSAPPVAGELQRHLRAGWRSYISHLAAHRALPASAYGAEPLTLGSDCIRFGDTRLKLEPSLRFRGRVAIVPLALLLAASAEQRGSRDHEALRESLSRGLPDSLVGYHGERGSGGGPPPSLTGIDRALLQRLVDAAERSPGRCTSGATGPSPSRNPAPSYTYCHPYSSEERPGLVGVCCASYEVTPCGVRQVHDLTVEGASSYIGESGQVSTNTHLGLDEAYQFEGYQYEELDARVRSADPVLMLLLRSRLMSNPAQGWLKERFVTPEPKGNVVHRQKVVNPETGQVSYRTRLFLPAKLDDNPDKAFVDQYKIRLLSKPAHMRARYLYGDWDSVEGGYFEDDYNPQVHVIDAFKIPRDWPKFRSMDWGFKAPGVIGWFAMDPDENLYQFYEFNFRLMKDEEVAKRVVEIETMFGFWNKRERRSRISGVADTQLWEERGDSGKSKAAVFAAAGVYWQPADKASIARNAERVSERLRDYDKDRPPGLMLFRECRKTAEMFASIGVDQNDSTIPDKNSPLKHWFDTVAYAAARASRGRGSLAMEPHEYDRPDNDNDEEPLGRAGGFGYGS